MQDSRKRQMTINTNLSNQPPPIPIKQLSVTNQINQITKPQTQQIIHQSQPSFHGQHISLSHRNSTRNSTIDKIHIEISRMDGMNKQLLNVAEKIKSTGMLSYNQTNNPVIDRIENDLRISLGQLIQSIMQFFKDIDHKLKNLGILVDSQFQKQAQSAARIDKNDLKYQLLAQKIQGLQISLRQTQQNQKKLIQVIQNMMQRYQILDQPTLIRDSPQLQNQFRKNRVNTSTTNLVGGGYQQQARHLHTMPSNNFIKPDTKTKSIYENLYTIQQSVVNQEIKPQHFRLRQIEQDNSEQVFIKNLYSKNPTMSSGGQMRKSLQRHQLYSAQRSLTTNKQRSTATQSSLQDDKQHRLNFMMGKLNL